MRLNGLRCRASLANMRQAMLNPALARWRVTRNGVAQPVNACPVSKQSSLLILILIRRGNVDLQSAINLVFTLAPPTGANHTAIRRKPWLGGGRRMPYHTIPQHSAASQATQLDGSSSVQLGEQHVDTSMLKQDATTRRRRT